MQKIHGNHVDYPISANPATITRGVFRDIDEQAAQLTAHDQRYRQLSCGNFNGTFVTAALGPDEWLYLENVNQALWMQGGGPQDAVSYMILLRENEECQFQGTAFTSDDLAVLPAGSEFSAVSATNAGFCVITLNAQTVEQMAGSHMPFHHACRLSSPSVGFAVQALRMLVRGSIAMAEQDAAATGIETAALIRRSLVSTLDLALSAIPADIPYSFSSTLFQRAMAVIEEQLDTIDVATLSRTLDVPRRTIESAFRREMGVGPARVMKLLRLDRIRRDIATEEPDVPLADIAARWGLWHPSHFTDDYHAMFGERPSDTRRQLRST